MKKTKNKIKIAILCANGLPNFTQRQYLKHIRTYLLDQLSDNELEMIRKEEIDLDYWILEITQEITEKIY